MDIFTNYGPKTWIENRESDVLKSIIVKIRGWRIINSEDGLPKTYKRLIVKLNIDDEAVKLYTPVDITYPGEIEESYTFSVPEEHQTDKLFYLHSNHHHYSQDMEDIDAGDNEYSEKFEEWIKLLEADSDFLTKRDSVITQLKALGEN
jgi:hypothetical protein